MRLKMAVLAPAPRASERMAMAVNAGLWAEVSVEGEAQVVH